MRLAVQMKQFWWTYVRIAVDIAIVWKPQDTLGVNVEPHDKLERVTVTNFLMFQVRVGPVRLQNCTFNTFRVA